MSSVLALLHHFVRRLLPGSVKNALDNYRLIFWRPDDHDRKLLNLACLTLSDRYPVFDIHKVDPSGPAESKGYTWVGCDSNGVNAVFVRRDVLKPDLIKPIAPAEAYFPNLRRLARGFTPKAQFAQIQHLPLVTV